MKLEILEREFKKEELEIGNLMIAYLLAIRNQHPDIWKQLKKLINLVDNYKFKGEAQ